MAFKRSARSAGFSRVAFGPGGRKRARKHGGFRARKGTRSLASLAMLSVEKKFFDVMVASHNLSIGTDGTNGFVNPSAGSLFTPNVGDGEQNRDGRKCQLLSVDIKGYIHESPIDEGASPVQAQKYHVALVLDKQTNGETIDREKVWTALLSGAQSRNLEFRNMKFLARYSVLYDRIITREELDLTNIGSSIWNAKGVSSYFRITKTLNHKVLFSDDTASNDDVVTHSLHMYCRPLNIDNVVVPSISYVSRCRFVG